MIMFNGNIQNIFLYFIKDINDNLQGSEIFN